MFSDDSRRLFREIEMPGLGDQEARHSKATVQGAEQT